MSFRLGVDFDNTLIEYDRTFWDLAISKGWLPADTPVSKVAVKRALLTKDGGDDLRWQDLQTEAYGPGIFSSPPQEGALAFLKETVDKGCEIFIVSHKTEKANRDPDVDLRGYALQWLEENRIFKSREQGGVGLPKDNVFFEATRAEKVERIRQLKCDCFVDDLSAVFEHEKFPRDTIPIWFQPHAGEGCSCYHRFCRWKDIGAYMRTLEELGEVAVSGIRHHLSPNIREVRSLRRGGNSQIARVETKEKTYLVKSYYQDPRDPRQRLATEYGAFSFLWGKGMRCIPQPLYGDATKGFAVYTFIEGAVLQGDQIREHHVLKAAEVLIRLWEMSREERDARIGPAADARLCLADYVRMVEKRLSKIERGCVGQSWGVDIKVFLRRKFKPLKEQVITRFYQRASQEHLDLERNIASTEKILSPSDFGFHNMLVDDREQLFLIDFEYFGWDDPAKLIGDFFHHVGQKLHWELKWLFLDRFCAGIDLEGFLNRWELVLDLLGLEWVLIVLNVASPESRARRRFAEPFWREEELIRQRLQKARDMVRGMAANQHNTPFISVPARAA